jgi:hypothetical protein
MKKIAGIILIIFVFWGLRWWNIEERMNFSMDQGTFLIRAKEIWDKKELVLIGPEASAVVEGRHFFQGPIIYCSIIMLGILGNWNPIWMSGWLAGVVLMTNLWLGKIIKKVINERTAWLYLVIISFLPISIQYSNFIWNPNFLLIITPLFLGALLNSWWFWAGVLAGIGIQFHFQFGVVILIALGWILIKNRKELGCFLIGMLLGYSPLLIFDLRNNYYNVRTIWLWLTTKNDVPIIVTDYYFLALVPAIALVISWWLAKKKPWVQIGTVMLIMTWGILAVTVKKKVVGMPDNWSYKDLVVTKETILKIEKEKYNVVNLLSGDSRFYPLRYLLRDEHLEEINNYKDLDTLLVVAKNDSQNEIENSRVWEIASFGGKVLEVKKINEVNSLYILKK